VPRFQILRGPSRIGFGTNGSTFCNYHGISNLQTTSLEPLQNTQEVGVVLSDIASQKGRPCDEAARIATAVLSSLNTPIE
jgi:hypothetical protein